MTRFYSVTWKDGNFDGSAAILAFESKRARAAYPMQCSQRVDEINSKKKATLRRAGYPLWLMFWDEKNPTQFKSSSGA